MEPDSSWLVATSKTLAGHPLLQLSGFIIAVVSLILAYVFYRRSLREKKPLYAVFSRTLVKDLTAKLPELRITFDGTPQERVTVTTVFFWNDGREAVRRTDIAHTDPLRIEIEEGASILSARIQEVTNKGCDAILARPVGSARVAMLSFEFLDHGDGITVNLVHNGAHNHRVIVGGTIVGGKIAQLPLSGSNRPRGPRWTLLSMAIKLLYWGLAILAIYWMLPVRELLEVESQGRQSTLTGWQTVQFLGPAVIAVIAAEFTERGIAKLMPRVPDRLWMLS